MKQITEKEIDALIKERGLTIEKVLDRVIQLNAIIGVGKYRLLQDIDFYLSNHRGYVKEEAEK